MNPVANYFVVTRTGRVALSPFIFMVGESKVDSPRMNIDAFAQKIHAHGAAFGMPTGEPTAPGCLPSELSTSVSSRFP